MKERVFSGIQPSGNLTIGNYLGALKNFSVQQDLYDCIYCVVDMHALTAGIKAEDLNRYSYEILSLYLAADLDPEKSIIYFQSHVPAHTELQWILNSITPLGQLSRMTQYKAKAEKHADNIYAGLLNYPILMAADIMLFDAKYVPVGDDQRQHLEFTRDLVEKFNSIYGETFVMPEMLATKTGTRIMSLQNPAAKMSKSDEDINGAIYILDSEKDIKKKIMRAVTDSVGVIAYNKDQAGLKNLIDIYSSFTDLSPDDIVKKFYNQGYGTFKKELVEVVVDGLRSIQNRYNEYMSNKDQLEEIYRSGAKKARKLANAKIKEVCDKIGLIEL